MNKLLCDTNENFHEIVTKKFCCNFMKKSLVSPKHKFLQIKFIIRAFRVTIDYFENTGLPFCTFAVKLKVLSVVLFI